jgi:hypothetical protein
VTTPTARRICASITDHETGQPMDRDAYARFLADRAYGLRDGARVRLTYGDGSNVTGTWETRPEYEDGPPVVLRLDNGTIHEHTAGQVERRVLDDEERLPLLTEGEALAIAGLLDELAAVYVREPLGRLAREQAVKLYDRLGI